ncbi:MAG: S-adenosylmethionine decarboxylase proenzyme [Spirochaetales bacterium]|nr:S-adenosylmethionine decarboxylase proenzyme [Spirochaetales bacterium]
MKALGNHLLIELYNCDSGIINDLRRIQSVMLEAVRVAGATVIQPVFHQFNPHGISGVVVIAESHFSIHTWPEYGYCALDIFTCGDEMDSARAVEYLKEEFCAGSLSIMEVKRGTLDIPKEKLLHKPVELC